MTDVDRFVVPEDASVRDALTILDRAGSELVVLCAEQRHVVGVLTDGDLRRALLSGASLADPVRPYANTSPLVVSPRGGREEALDLMRAHRISQVPVVDRDGSLVGLHLLHDVISPTMRPNWAVVMAGGRGTRLGAITDSTPKPMVPVAGRPLLERLVLHLVSDGVREVFLSVNYRADDIIAHFGGGERFGCTIRYVRESPDRPLGTAGSLSLLRDVGGTPTEPVLVMNGDVLTQLPVGAFLDAHTSTGAVATVAVKEHAYRVPFGVVTARGTRLESLVEKPVERWRVNAGAYVLDPYVLQRVPTGTPYDLTDLLAHCLAQDEHVGVFEFAEEWIDVGRPSDLERARGG